MRQVLFNHNSQLTAAGLKPAGIANYCVSLWASRTEQKGDSR